MLKISRYLHVVPLDGKVGVVNALSGAVAFISPELADTISQAEGVLIDEIAHRFPELQGIGAFVPCDVNELDLVRVRMGKARFGDRSLNLTVVPTLACNMRCTYCDQPEYTRKSEMSQETCDAVISYVATKMDSCKLLSITWYGGEPLLAFDRMVKMQRSFYQLCAERKIPMICNITTNATLVTREKMMALKDLGIRQAQITLDGPERIHDRRRFMRDGSGTFDRTLDGILSIRDIMDVRVRVNVDRENASALPELMVMLERHGLAGNVYPAPVVGYAAPCHPSDSAMLSGPDYADALSGVMDYMSVEEIEGCLTPAALPCTAPSESTYVFGPRGHIYRCWHDLDYDERAIDHVVSGEGSPSRRLFWLTYDPLLDPLCAECNVLPLCMGGCPERRKNGITQPTCCSPLKTHIAAFVKRYSDALAASSRSGGQPHD
jgi:uncharacterized protein